MGTVVPALLCHAPLRGKKLRFLPAPPSPDYMGVTGCRHPPSPDCSGCRCRLVGLRDVDRGVAASAAPPRKDSVGVCGHQLLGLPRRSESLLAMTR